MLLPSNLYLTGIEDVFARLLHLLNYYILGHVLEGKIAEFEWQSCPEGVLAVWSHLELGECGGKVRQQRSKEDSREMPWYGVLWNTFRVTGLRKGSSTDLAFVPLILQATASCNAIHIKFHPKVITPIRKDFLLIFNFKLRCHKSSLS